MTDTHYCVIAQVTGAPGFAVTIEAAPTSTTAFVITTRKGVDNSATNQTVSFIVLGDQP